MSASDTVSIPVEPTPELLELMRSAYHASRPRWDEQNRCSMHTGLEAAYLALVKEMADGQAG